MSRDTGTGAPGADAPAYGRLKVNWAVTYSCVPWRHQQDRAHGVAAMVRGGALAAAGCLAC